MTDGDALARAAAANSLIDYPRETARSWPSTFSPMDGRRILRVDNGTITVARESRFDTEQDLHSAIGAHPEVLPFEDFGLGVLVTIGNEVQAAAGWIDTLAVDPSGRLVIVEYKKGTENRDVRKVLAQVLDYGSALWRSSLDDLERLCLTHGGDLSIEERVANRLVELDIEGFDASAFRTGLAANLDSGEFVFLYVVRDLDDRTRRVMTYLAEGPRMSFFAVEVDYFREGAGDSAVLVPRAAFVPSWILTPSTPPRPPGVGRSERIATASDDVKRMWTLMEEYASRRGLIAQDTPTGRMYRPRPGASGVGVYASIDREVELDIVGLRTDGHPELAQSLLERLSSMTGRPMASDWPRSACAPLLADWNDTTATILDPYFDARSQQAPPPTMPITV